MLLRGELENDQREVLTPDRFPDDCPNGMQVEGKAHIKRLVTGVTASQAFLHQAILHEADAVLVDLG